MQAWPGILGGACALLALGCGWGPARAQEAGTYRNPLPVTADDGPVTSCADPSVVGDAALGWTMYCTTDPLSGDDRDAGGDLRFRLLPTFRSDDLVAWTHVGEAFARGPEGGASAPPAWAADSALLWAPEGTVIEGRHYLLFGVTDVADAVSGEPGCTSDGAIGYAVGPTPTGPWTAAEAPLVEPRRAGEGCDFLWTYDPEVVQTPDGRVLLFYGSYYGGIEVREVAVSPDGALSTRAAEARPVAIPNRYEGAEVIFHDGAWWLFASASNCCNGPQTGYGVFVARADNPEGPFLDRSGASLLEAGVGGTPALLQNGNGFVGPGHNTLIQDAAGQWWTLYHAVEEAEPWFGDEVGFTRRPVLLDPISWVEGWPVVAGGPSDEPRPAPALAAAAPGAADFPAHAGSSPGTTRPEASDEFAGEALGPAWSWVRQPGGGGVTLGDGVLRIAVSDTDLHEDRNDAPVLLREAPDGDFMLETRVAVDWPAEGCCQNYVQAGLVLYGDDDNYLKLVAVSIWETRQTEFARERGPVPAGFPRYGSSVGGPVGPDWTWLRLSVRRGPEGEIVTAFTSRDGERWDQGATWMHDLGQVRIGLVAMGGPGGHAARFDYVRTFEVD